MLADLFPRAHLRYAGLPLLGQHLDGLVEWLQTEGHADLPVRLRVRAAESLDTVLRREGVVRLEELTADDLLAFAPASSQDDVYRSALVRSLVQYLATRGVLRQSPSTPVLSLTAAYRHHLEDLRGFSKQTVKHHTATVRELLGYLGEDGDEVEARLRSLDGTSIEGFLKILAPRLSRESLQHSVSHLRSFLRFLAAGGRAPGGLADAIDTPRVYRGERLPRALPWETVQTLLRVIDRSSPMGLRDYAMFLLMTTYGLRSCEVVALMLDDIDWRTDRLHVSRPKVRAPLVLPLTPGVGDAILEYLKDGRPALADRRVFLRVRSPAGHLKPTAVTEAFQGWVRRGKLAISYQGPHCLRHSLAIHLLRQGAPLKTIGDLLGHRSFESTCVYLRLQIDDLREVALALPPTARRRKS